jgi:hypothetical protein
MRDWPEALKIVLFSVAAAGIYGILHDQVTAHLCVEYFTVAHPMIIPTHSPFLLAMFWGIFATWWVGLSLGAGLALAARLGPAPRVSASELALPVLMLMILCGIAALLAGMVGARLMTHGLVTLNGWYADVIPAERHVAFFADASAHLTSYAAGGIGGLVLISLTIWKRLRAAARLRREGVPQDSRPS